MEFDYENLLLFDKYLHLHFGNKCFPGRADLLNGQRIFVTCRIGSVIEKKYKGKRSKRILIYDIRTEDGRVLLEQNSIPYNSFFQNISIVPGAKIGFEALVTIKNIFRDNFLVGNIVKLQYPTKHVHFREESDGNPFVQYELPSGVQIVRFPF